ncbi:hypothetical protein DdX_06719 [Ditylenchus destructor]|uniref:Uncharacterized protein n=1 Tax=Ditylenchus destructor TaxID=166010 RepID=A0AAD4N6E8_9BILA|nr:hypothetical protein DdX_06719 [Ditylenchus destructor]
MLYSQFGSTWIMGLIGLTTIATLLAQCKTKRQKVPPLKDKNKLIRKALEEEENRQKQRNKGRVSHGSSATRTLLSTKDGSEKAKDLSDKTQHSRKKSFKNGSSGSKSTESGSRSWKSSVKGVDDIHSGGRRARIISPQSSVKSSAANDSTGGPLKKSSKMHSQKKTAVVSNKQKHEDLKRKRKSLRRRMGEGKSTKTDADPSKSPYGERGRKSRVEEAAKRNSKKHKKSDSKRRTNTSSTSREK